MPCGSKTLRQQGSERQAMFFHVFASLHTEYDYTRPYEAALRGVSRHCAVLHSNRRSFELPRLSWLRFSLRIDRTKRRLAILTTSLDWSGRGRQCQKNQSWILRDRSTIPRRPWPDRLHRTSPWQVTTRSIWRGHSGYSLQSMRGFAMVRQ